MGCRDVIIQRVRRELVIARTERGTVNVTPPARGSTTTRVSREVDVERDRSVLVKEYVPREVDIVRPGIQGPRGFPGGSIPPIHFSFGDAPAVRYTDEAPGTYTRIRVDFTTPFNGAAPAVIVGTPAAHDILMLAVENDPLIEAGFEVTTDLHVAGATGVWLEITSSGSTQGAGVLYLEFLPD